MSGWSQDDIDLRNLRVFGVPEPPVPAGEKAKDVPEALIEAECTRFLQEDGWRALRTDPVSRRSRGTGFGEVGMADHWFGRPLPGAGAYAVEMVWVEFKTANRRAGKRQQAWHALERARGFTVWVANETFPATIEGFREHYANSGLMRRPRWW